MNAPLGIGFLCLFSLLSACLFQFSPSPLNGQTYGLVAFALILEMTAVHLPTLGFISASFPIYFLLCFLPGLGPVSAALGVLAVLTLRSVMRRGSDWSVLGFEFLLDGCSVMSAIFIGGLLRETEFVRVGKLPISVLALLASLSIYWLLQVKLYSYFLSQFKVTSELSIAQKEAIGVQARASAMCAPALLFLVWDEPWHILWTLPVFLALYQSNWETLSELRRARIEKSVAQRESVQKDKTLLAAAKNMQALQEQKRLVQMCSEKFAQTTNSREGFEALVEVLRKVLSFDSAAVMLYQGGGLQPLHCYGPHTQSFLTQNETEVREQLIGKAWRSAQAQHLNGPDGRPRIFEGEKYASAFPLHGQGVLYVGAAKRSIGGEDAQRLATVVYQYSLSLQSTLREEALAETLVKVKEANHEIELGRERLIQLVEGSHKMVQKLDFNSILQQTSATLMGLFQPEHTLIRVFSWGDHSLGEAPPADIMSLVEAKLSKGQVGLLERMSSASGELSVYAHKLSWEGRTLGFIAMSSHRPDHFRNFQRRFLELLALHCSVMLTNAQLYQDVQKARKDLQESQAQLVQSSKLAAVGQLAAGVAHELNTPLGAVLLSLQSAERQLRKGRPEKVMEKIENGILGAEAAKDIVEKLLFYSREGREDRSEISLREVISDTIQFLGSQITDDNIELETAIEEDCHVEGNQNELQQILINFLVNARDAILEGDKGGGQVKISLQAINDEAWLTVHDSGIGFSQEVKEKAFDPFYTTKPIGTGTGLGLHVSRQIAERHQGRVEVHSEVGHGAKVSLILPSKKAVAASV